MNAFGVEVTVVEMMPRILPVEDHETAAVVEKAFVKRGVKFHVAPRPPRSRSPPPGSN